MLTNVLFGQVLSTANDPSPTKAAGSTTRSQGKSFSDHLDGQRDRADTESASETATEAREADAPEATAAPKDGETVESGSATSSDRSETASGEASDKDAVDDSNNDAGDGIAPDPQAAETDSLVKLPEAAVVQTPEMKVVESRLRDGTSKVAISQKAPSDTGALGVNGDSGEAVADPKAAVTPSETTAGTSADPSKGAPDEKAVAEPLRQQGQPAIASGVDSSADKTFSASQAATTQSSGEKAAGQTALPVTQQVEAQESVEMRDFGTRFAGLRNGDVQPQGTTETPNKTPVQASNGPSAGAPVETVEADLRVVSDGGDTVESVDVARLAGDASRGAGSVPQAAVAAAGQSGAAVTSNTEPGRRAQARAAESREAPLTATDSEKTTTTAATTPTTPQVSAVQQAFAAQALAGDQAGSGAQSDASVLAGESGPDMPGLSQLLTEAVLQPGTTYRPETPRLVAVQLAEAFAAKGERKVDVALNPEELGRVKMRVTTNESGITVVIQTERPETGDLMRRHINELADEFRKMGFENISFEFSGGQTSGGQTESDGETRSGNGQGLSGNSDEMAAAEVAQTATQHLRLGAAGVDMRV